MGCKSQGGYEGTEGRSVQVPSNLCARPRRIGSPRLRCMGLGDPSRMGTNQDPLRSQGSIRPWDPPAGLECSLSYWLAMGPQASYSTSPSLPHLYNAAVMVPLCWIVHVLRTVPGFSQVQDCGPWFPWVYDSIVWLRQTGPRRQWSGGSLMSSKGFRPVCSAKGRRLQCTGLQDQESGRSLLLIV